MLKFYCIVLLILSIMLIILSCLQLFVFNGKHVLSYISWLTQGAAQLWIACEILGEDEYF